MSDPVTYFIRHGAPRSAPGRRKKRGFRVYFEEGGGREQLTERVFPTQAAAEGWLARYKTRYARENAAIERANRADPAYRAHRASVERTVAEREAKERQSNPIRRRGSWPKGRTPPHLKKYLYK